VNRNPSTQSSHSQSHDAIPSPTLPLGTTVPPSANPSFEKSIPSSGPEIHHPSQTPVYCPQPDWPESTDYNAFTDTLSANSRQQSTSIAVPSHPTYCPQPEWSEPNEFQPFAGPACTISTQLPQSGPIGYPPPEWSKFPRFNPIMEIPVNMTPPSLSEAGFPQGPIGRQQTDWSGYDGLQHTLVNPWNTQSQIYQSGQPVSSAC